MGNGNVISYHTGAYASALCFTKPNIVSLFHIENQNVFCVWLLLFKILSIQHGG